MVPIFPRVTGERQLWQLAHTLASINHRTVKDGRHRWKCLVQPPAQSKISVRPGCPRPCPVEFAISMMMENHSFSGPIPLFDHSFPPPLYFIRIVYITTCACCLLFWPCAHLRRSRFCLYEPSQEAVADSRKNPLDLVFRPNKPSPHLLFLQHVFQPPATLVTYPLIHSSLSMSFLHWAQNCTDSLRCHLVGAKRKGTISSLDLLAALLLVQPNMMLLVHTGIVVYQDPKRFFRKGLPSQPGPACPGAGSYSVTDAGLCGGVCSAF